MESNIDMGQHSITNLKDPEAHQATYAANVNLSLMQLLIIIL